MVMIILLHWSGATTPLWGFKGEGHPPPSEEKLRIIHAEGMSEASLQRIQKKPPRVVARKIKRDMEYSFEFGSECKRGDFLPEHKRGTTPSKGRAYNE